MSIRHWTKDCLTDWNSKTVNATQLQTIARGFEVFGKLVDGPDGSMLTNDVVAAARREDLAPLNVTDWKQRVQKREALSNAFRRFGGTSKKLLFARLGWAQISSGRAILVLSDTPWTRAAIRVLRLLGRYEGTDWTTLLEESSSLWIASEELHPPLRAAPACRKQVLRGHLHTWPVSETNPHLPALLSL
jgi:hypothetical protein